MWFKGRGDCFYQRSSHLCKILLDVLVISFSLISRARNSTLRPTLALLRQRLYRTSEAPLKLLHVYYNLTIYVLRTNR